MKKRALPYEYFENFEINLIQLYYQSRCFDSATQIRPSFLDLRYVEIPFSIVIVVLSNRFHFFFSSMHLVASCYYLGNYSASTNITITDTTKRRKIDTMGFVRFICSLKNVMFAQLLVVNSHYPHSGSHEFLFAKSQQIVNFRTINQCIFNIQYSTPMLKNASKFSPCA